MKSATETPCPAEFYAQPDEYWNMVDRLRASDGLPEWTFDFLSIHHNERGMADGKNYSLLGPSKLVVDGKRPAFEKLRFSTFIEAKQFAIRIAKRTKFSVVNCNAK